MSKGVCACMVGFRDIEQAEEVYRKYKAWLDYLYKLYAQGVPVVVPSTTSVPDPDFPLLRLSIPSTSSAPVDSQNSNGG